MHRPPISITRPLLLALLAFAFLGLALIPRTLGLADFITTDEAYHWIDRTERFSAAVAGQHWADTLLTGHPGVTTMWLGSIGRALEQNYGRADPHIPELVAHLAWLRLPIAIMHALVVAIAFLLLYRLFGQAIALIASFLWATAPYLIAHGRLLHLDANLADFVVLSILFLLVAYAERTNIVRQSPHFGYLCASGICAGLALLTKGPALIMLPFVGLTLLGLVIQNRQQAGVRPSFRQLLVLAIRSIPRAVFVYSCWLAIALLVVYALWPALWVTPGAALERYIGEITTNGGRPNGDGQFFLGRANADPGPLFYPIADLFRSTPVMLIGLFAAVVFALRTWLRQRHRPFEPTPPSVRYLAVLAAFVLFWTLVMTLGPKKFDRYILPTWPVLIILAAAGLASLVAAIPRRSLRIIVLSLGLATELATIAWYQPYYLSYYNPLLGGGRVAQQIFLIGWGEGMDQVGVYLQERPDLRYGPVLSALGATLQPFVPVDVRDVEDFGRLPANYAIVYRESLQREANPALYAQLQTTVALQTITIHGIDYAWIYQLPRPFRQPIDAWFGEALRLRGFTLEQSPNRITLTPAWDVRVRPAGDYQVFVHLLNQQGTRVAEINLPPGGGDAPPTSAWQAGQQIAVPFPLELPPNLAPGEYQLVMGVYAVASGTRLPLRGGLLADPGVAGNDALLITTVRLPNGH
ncbi:MAG: phospholipid carrier-dependent glycosyltransferase [Roseiflexaceae bacterium]|nr:phospholipid carrier-dependent glycosyltransferase [Roseiflexaceae bacterium]